MSTRNISAGANGGNCLVPPPGISIQSCEKLIIKYFHLIKFMYIYDKESYSCLAIQSTFWKRKQFSLSLQNYIFCLALFYCNLIIFLNYYSEVCFFLLYFIRYVESGHVDQIKIYDGVDETSGQTTPTLGLLS